MGCDHLLHSELTGRIIEAAYEVYNELGFGFLEAVYEKALLIALRERGIQAERQVPINVFFHGQDVGYYEADLFVEELVIVELK
jgi:GxxExxY protein